MSFNTSEYLSKKPLWLLCAFQAFRKGQSNGTHVKKRLCKPLEIVRTWVKGKRKGEGTSDKIEGKDCKTLWARIIY